MRRRRTSQRAGSIKTGTVDEVWASYRFVALSDTQEQHGLKIIDLGAGHSSASETLCGLIVGALKSEALLNENVGAGYIDRRWPPAFEGTGLAADEFATELPRRLVNAVDRP